MPPRPASALIALRRRVCLCFLILLLCPLSGVAQFDESKLPAPATVTVDYGRDIKPILSASCIRCHGSERPRSRFRLDNSEDALKGGKNAVDIIPGNSAKSPLVHYVAQLEPGMEMPPVGKGYPLSAAQVALLRAWIDQGVAWDAVQPRDKISLSLSPAIGSTSVNGNIQKFREDYWQKQGINGGLAQFDLAADPGANTKLNLSGHALEDDYKVVLSLAKNDLGFVHAGWEEYRKYYNNTGGYLPSLPLPEPALASDLYLDIGKAWVDFGLTLPNWPKMVLGFEQDYRRGGEATADWNAVPGKTQSFAPASQKIDEQVNILKFDLDHEVGGVAIEERFRGEFYNLKNSYTNLDARQPVTEKTQEGNSYFQGANTIRLEKKFTDWLFGSAGYLYSKLNADASFTDAASNPSFHTAYTDIVPRITLEKESQVLNANALLRPFDGLTVSTGVQTEWTRQQGFGGGSALLNPIFTNGSAPVPGNGPAVLSRLSSDYDETSATETVGVRYGKIPYTILFADARLQQQRIGQSNDDLQHASDFIQNTAFSSQMTDCRLGFNTSPWRSVSFNAHYRRYENNSQYQDTLAAPAPAGYPGFIRERDLLTDEAVANLVLRPCSWLKTTLSWQYLTQDYSTVTDATPSGRISPGGSLLSGQYASRVYSINTTLTPRPGLYLSTAFSYQPTASISAANGASSVPPYRGDIYSVIACGTYSLNRNMDLFANYSFSAAHYGEGDISAGLPLGIEYAQNAVAIGLARRFGKNLTVRLQYGYDRYAEPTSGGANNYSANSIFAILTFKGP